MNIKAVTILMLPLIFPMTGSAWAAPAGTDCIPASRVRQFAEDHNFKIRELSALGLRRALADWKNNSPGANRAAKAAFGFYLRTSEYQVKQNGKVVGWKPMDTGLITLYAADKTCFAYTEGTQQQTEDILSDSAGSLKGVFK